jgi:uncharacterized protein with ParB-like and HNH nuclease domain
MSGAVNEIVEPVDQVGWYEDASDDEEEKGYAVGEYEITTSPNDWNVSTLVNFIESGAVKIPGFQRNFVWDINRASKLIESVIIGLPIPQIFLYEESRNRFLVIDGQQRLMSIYYFVKQRFPRKEKRTELRRIFDENGKIPERIFHDDSYFTKFNLSLPEKPPEQPNKFKGLNYETLDEHKLSFDLRTIRNVIVKQVSPKDDDTAIYEIFNRLNSGGVNLKPQEIRMSLYHSDFYDMLHRVNMNEEWRKITGIVEPDLHMKDLEFMLRGFAMLIANNKYGSSMARFLNSFSKEAKNYKPDTIEYLKRLFESFLQSCQLLDQNAFQSSTKRFSITLYESVFVAVCAEPYAQRQLVSGKITPTSLAALKSDQEFQDAAESRTTSQRNVKTRLRRACDLIDVVN